MSPVSPVASTVDPDDAVRFERIARLWWDPTGPFWPLHRMNGFRSGLIETGVASALGSGRDPGGLSPLKDRSLLDIGCGGGLLSEAMALRGAKVMGIDSVARNIEIADQHARANGLSVTYRHQTVEALAETGQTYDVVLALEVVEHVLDLPLFLASTAKLVRPGGVLILSTLNRTFKSYCLAIVGAEYILRWLPRGTHQWRKFVPPSFLIGAMESQGFELRDSIGVAMNPFTRRFRRTPSLAVNYTLVFVESAREQSV